jgi:hypothetical protein
MRAPYTEIEVLSVESLGDETYTFHIRCRARAFNLNDPETTPAASILDGLVSIHDKFGWFFTEGEPLAGHVFGESEITEWMTAHEGKFDIAAFLRDSVPILGMQQRG